MRLLKLREIGLDETNYINLEKITNFHIEYMKDTKLYAVHIEVSGRCFLLAVNVKEPKKIIENLLNTINTIDNDIIEFTVIDNKRIPEQN